VGSLLVHQLDEESRENLDGHNKVLFTMALSEIISRLQETQNKSEAPAEFEQAIADAFAFLGVEAQVIGGPGDTDVLLTANIVISSPFALNAKIRSDI
jgi:hypothetical protein